MKKSVSINIQVPEAMNEASYAYIESKAGIFLEIGPGKYAARDAFHQPGKRLPASIVTLLQAGCSQILRHHGRSRDDPFEGLGIAGFYRLLRMFHFHPLHQSIALITDECIIDRITFSHQVTGYAQMVVLYNKVLKV